MSRKPQDDHEDESYELNQSRNLFDRDDLSDPEDDSVREGLLHNEQPAYPRKASALEVILSRVPFSKRRNRLTGRKNQQRSTRSLCHSLGRTAIYLTSILFVTLAITAVFFSSYTSPPARYAVLRKRVQEAGQSTSGAGNPDNKKVFIAASIFDKSGDLADGKWGECVVQLIHILGPQNVYLSVYENDAGSVAEQALKKLESKVQSQKTMRYDEHMGFDEVEHVTLPDGSSRVKRITYLSEARNRALLPLVSAEIQYDKVLYLNDVVFDPVEAAQLLFLTGDAGQGQTFEYRAACAVDYINLVKFYDTFALRDSEGYGVGLPFFPWFTTAGQGLSRRKALAGSDAIPVRSCWGGMVAFDARFFQPTQSEIPTTAGSKSPANITAPYYFRAEDDLYWDASECCLIHADIQSPDPASSGIFMNPYVRTAYDWHTLQWLGFSRRFERLFVPIHWIISKLVGMPWYNPRRDERPWEPVKERVWVPESGSFEQLERIAGHSGFCGRRALQLMKVDLSSGGKPWEFAPVPPQ